jgi:hypothetical protein
MLLSHFRVVLRVLLMKQTIFLLPMSFNRKVLIINVLKSHIQFQVYQVVGVAGIAGGSVDILFKDHGCTI